MAPPKHRGVVMMEKGAMVQGTRASSRSEKRQGTNSALEPPEGTSPADTRNLVRKSHFGFLTSRTARE